MSLSSKFLEIINEIIKEEDLTSESMTFLGLDLLFEAEVVFVQFFDECVTFVLERVLVDSLGYIASHIFADLLVGFDINQVSVLIDDLK